MCRRVGFEIRLSPFCCWKEQETREQEWCVRPGHILKQERELGQLGWPSSGNMTREGTWGQRLGSWTPLRIW